jgi:hypothetical protein
VKVLLGVLAALVFLFGMIAVGTALDVGREGDVVRIGQIASG